MGVFPALRWALIEWMMQHRKVDHVEVPLPTTLSGMAGSSRGVECWTIEEVLQALAADTAPVPRRICALLGLPSGASFATVAELLFSARQDAPERSYADLLLELAFRPRPTGGSDGARRSTGRDTGPRSGSTRPTGTERGDLAAHACGGVSALHLELRAGAGEATVVVRGELDAHTVARFREFVCSIDLDDRLVLDMQELAFVDVAGVEALAELARTGRPGRPRVTLVGARRAVRRVLHLADVDDAFELR